MVSSLRALLVTLRPSLGSRTAAAVVAIGMGAMTLGTVVPAAAQQEAEDAPLLTPSTVVERQDAVTISGPNRAAESDASNDGSTGEAVPLATVLAIVFALIVAVALASIAGTTVWWMLHAWKTPEALKLTAFGGDDETPKLSFSLIVPARHEEAVLGETLDTLAATDHPNVEILAVVGHDDPGTEAVARAAAARHPGLIRVLVDDSVPKNKPKALNLALQHCRGQITGVFDAEDEVHPQLVRRVDARFVTTGADVVQGGVQLMNAQSSWFALRNVLEYYFWFRSRLHFQAEKKFIPLGGNTVFARTELLRAVKGWDQECLAEDCELGVRLSSLGATVAVAYDPEIVTREETPDTIRSFVKQRTRWHQGFLQVLRKGEWRALPSWRQRALARYTLTMPFLQALTGVLVPASLLMILFVELPVWVALFTFIPLVPTLVTLFVEVVGFHEFCGLYGLKARARDYLRLVVGTIPYQLLLSFAAVRAVVRELRGDGSWEKTSHANTHRNPNLDLRDEIDLRDEPLVSTR